MEILCFWGDGGGYLWWLGGLTKAFVMCDINQCSTSTEGSVMRDCRIEWNNSVSNNYSLLHHFPFTEVRVAPSTSTPYPTWGVHFYHTSIWHWRCSLRSQRQEARCRLGETQCRTGNRLWAARGKKWYACATTSDTKNGAQPPAARCTSACTTQPLKWCLCRWNGDYGAGGEITTNQTL
jgi:hypothetical protein